MQAVVHDNPRCGKSRATLALLKQHGAQPTVIDRDIWLPAAVKDIVRRNRQNRNARCSVWPPAPENTL